MSHHDFGWGRESVLVLAERDRFAVLTFATLGLVAAALALRFVGVPSVDLHGPLHYAGVMDPFCGGTRATFLLFSGDLAGVVRYNPGVLVLAASVVAVLVRAVVGMVSGRWLEVVVSARWRRAVRVLVVVAVVLLWVRQQVEADLLTDRWPPGAAT